MTEKYRVTTSQLNRDGVHGAWLLLLSPIFQMAGWLWYFREPSAWPLALIAVTSLTFLGGFILLLVGRDQYTRMDE